MARTKLIPKLRPPAAFPAVLTVCLLVECTLGLGFTASTLHLTLKEIFSVPTKCYLHKVQTLAQLQIVGNVGSL
jgi:hypothetical protein